MENQESTSSRPAGAMDNHSPKRAPENTTSSKSEESEMEWFDANSSVTSWLNSNKDIRPRSSLSISSDKFQPCNSSSYSDGSKQDPEGDKSKEEVPVPLRRSLRIAEFMERKSRTELEKAEKLQVPKAVVDKKRDSVRGHGEH